MNLNIDVSCKIGDSVRFQQINATGKIQGILIQKNSIMYQIRYIFNGEVKEGYFYADEIRRTQNA